MLQSILGLPRSFAAMRGMFTFLGFVLDIGIINLLPFVSKEASGEQRVEKFPWALGGCADAQLEGVVRSRLASNGDTHTCIDRVPMQCFGRGAL